MQATSYSVRTYVYDYPTRTCTTTATLETLTQFPARTATSTARAGGYATGGWMSLGSSACQAAASIL